MEMQRGTIYSAILHIGVACLLIFGVPVFMDKEVLDSQPMIVEMVQIADKTNPPPSKEPREEPPKPTPKPVEDKPPPPQAKPIPPPPPPPPEPPKQVAEIPPEPMPKPPEPKPPEVKPEPKPEVKKEPPPPPKETATPPPRVANIVPPKKPKPKKAKPKPEDFINSILKDVAPKPRATEKSEAKQTPQKSPSPSPSPPSLDQQVTMSEIDAVRRQIQQCWNIPAGARDAGNLVVTIHATVAPDGTVRSARIENTSRMSDPFYRAAAESAQRAVLNPRCQPLKLPPEKYEQWKDLRLDFNPKDMIG